VKGLRLGLEPGLAALRNYSLNSTSCAVQHPSNQVSKLIQKNSMRDKPTLIKIDMCSADVARVITTGSRTVN